MTTKNLYPVPDSLHDAHVNAEQYDSMYQASVEDSDNFWAEQANKYVTWSKPWDKVQTNDFENGDIRWFEGGKLNVSYNCLDRHLETRGDQVAIIWEGDSPEDSAEIRKSSDTRQWTTEPVNYFISWINCG